MNQGSNPTKAMVEVALALAMGFFSIMVLAMVSMSTGLVAEDPHPGLLNRLVIQEPSNWKNTAGQIPGTNTPVKKSDLIIWFSGTFYDSNLNQVDPISWKQRAKNPVLAVTPDTNLNQLLTVRNKLEIQNVTFTSLNKEWLSRLKSIRRKV